MFSGKSISEKLIRKMKPSDMAMIKLSMLSLGLLLATYFKELAAINPGIYLALFIIFTIKPLMLYLQK